MELFYDVTTKTSRNLRGVETRVPGFGDTASVEFIDASFAARLLGDAGSIFAPFVNSE